MSLNRPELLRQAALRGKYARLYHHLVELTGNEWRATFDEIEKILGFKLPNSARVHRPWWANQGEQGGHSHALAWETAGWKTSQVDMSGERVAFVRDFKLYTEQQSGVAPLGHVAGQSNTAPKSGATTPPHISVQPPIATRPAKTNAPDLDGALVLISCVKSKLAHRAPARMLYTSAWFRGVRNIVEASDARWFVLSSLYGLVAPNEEIAPYDYTLNSLGVAERQAWANKVLEKLLPETAGFRRIVMFAGVRYREFLIRPLEHRGIIVDIPMENLTRGEQLKWLTQHR